MQPPDNGLDMARPDGLTLVGNRALNALECIQVYASFGLHSHICDLFI